MKIHHYDEKTGEWLAEGMADPDPLEPGRWLIPAHATTDEPPTPGAGQFAAWNGSAWELRDIPPPPPEPEPVAVPAPLPVTTNETPEPTEGNGGTV